MGRDDRTIRTAYFLRIPNVGDRVTPSIVRALTGRAARHFSGRLQPHLIAAGSVMAGATRLSHIWGTGVMHPDLGVGNAPHANVHALRGSLSHSALRSGGIPVRDVPLGDPGYLAPRLLGIERSSTPAFRVGLAFHYVDRSHPVCRRMMQEAGVADLNVCDPPDVFLGRMAECDVVISSSLHGLIFAEALSIPSLWIKASDEIAGDGFKFRDWFTTTRRPQEAPHLVVASDTAGELARRAELHESTIDVEALAAAFPHRHLEEMSEPAGRPVVPVEECRTRPTPVFLISFNRGRFLKQAIASIRRLSRATEIIVHDNGSTDVETVAILKELEEGGVSVFRYPAIRSDDDLNRIDETVTAHFADWAEPGRYVVSDCDVDMSSADPRALDVYDELLNTFRRVECAGPMLRIRDIPRTYPLFNRVMNRHIEQFWRHVPTLTETSFGEVAILPAAIDTTFALHRAGEPFRRLKSAVRVYEPFEALHLDWYLTGTEEHGMYARTSSPRVSHWNNEEAFEKHRTAPLDYQGFYAVRTGTGGRLEIYEERLMSTLYTDCGGPYDLQPEHTISCWEAEPLSPAEATLFDYLLANPSVVSGKRLFHIGIGNSQLPVGVRGLVQEYVGITISQPELDLFNRTFADDPRMTGLLMNKYDHRQFPLIAGQFDIILDTLLKSMTCCEKHFIEMMEFFVGRLVPGGIILSTRNGINFGWPGNTARAFTPGSQTDPAVRESRVLGEPGLRELAGRLGLEVKWGPTGATGDVVLTLRKA
jgi:hypothetical protein